MTSSAEWYPKELQSRAQRHRKTIWTKYGEMDAVYCLNCGRSCGCVTKSTASVMAICESCAATHGGLPLPQLTQEDLDRIGYLKDHEED